MFGFCRDRTGFTLVELLTVIALITVLLAVAMPAFFPVIAFSRLEGAARHVANYGRAAMAHATLEHERLTVKIDLKKQQYWTVRWLDVSGELFELDGKSDEKTQAQQPATAEEAEEEARAKKAEEMQERFNRLARLTNETWIKKLEKNDKDGLFSDFEPLFEKEFTLRDTDKEEEIQEVKTPLLQRTSVDEDIEIEAVIVGDSRHSKGIAEIEVTPMGLEESVVFYLKNNTDEYYTVIWDPVTGGAELSAGKKRAS